MSAHFTVVPDFGRRLLDVTMSGFFTPDDVARYAAAVDAATTAIGGAPATQVMINDISGMNIQGQEIVDRFRAFVANPRYQGRRVAFIVAGSLARHQLVRIIGSRTVQLFGSRTEAEAWLFEGERAAA